MITSNTRNRDEVRVDEPPVDEVPRLRPIRSVTNIPHHVEPVAQEDHRQDDRRIELQVHLQIPATHRLVIIQSQLPSQIHQPNHHASPPPQHPILSIDATRRPTRRAKFQTCPTYQTTNTPVPRRPAKPTAPTPLSPGERGASKRSAASGVCPGRQGAHQPNNHTPITAATHSSAANIPLSRWTGEGWGEGPGRSGARQPNTTITPPHQTQHPITAHHSNHKNHSSDNPPTKHHLPSTASQPISAISGSHPLSRWTARPLDFDTTSVVQIKTSAQPDTRRTRRPETSPRRTGLCAQLFSMLQLPTYKQGSADGSPHGEPEATAQAER